MQGLENNPKPKKNTKKSSAFGFRAFIALLGGGLLGLVSLPPSDESIALTSKPSGRTPRSALSARVLPTDAGAGGVAVAGASSQRRGPARSRGVILRRGANVPADSAPEPAGEVLFVADDGATYSVRHDLSLAESQGRFGPGWTVFENARGTLQSLPQRTLDPSVSLQWHNFSWPSLLLDRFPLSLDQSTPGLRMRRVDEFLFWMPRDFLPSALPEETTSSACPAHQPASLHVNRLWGYFDDDALLSGTVLLQDGGVDVAHADLRPVTRGALQPASPSREVAPLLSVHGTHVAGVMAARRNDFGVTGVAPGLQVETFSLRESEGFTVELADVLEGIARIETRLSRASSDSKKPRTVLMSTMFEDDVRHLTTRGTPLRDAMESLLKHDVIVVVPAGNGTPSTRGQASLPSALTPFLEGRKGILVPVAASDLCSDRAWFSRMAPLASGTLLFAPGERIFSTLPNGDYGYLSGSSQSAAQVAALLALGSHFAPHVPVRALVDALVRTAQPMPHINSRAFMPDAWSFLVEVEQKR